MKREIIMIPVEQAESKIYQLKNKDALFYYLSNDYQRFICLKNKFIGQIELRNTAGLLNDVFGKIKESLLNAFSRMNRIHNSFDWWGCQLASKSTTSTSLSLNVTYYFCAKKIILESDRNIVFIAESIALSKCIENLAERMGCLVTSYRTVFFETFKKIKQLFYYIAQVLYYFLTILKHIFLSFRHKKPFFEQDKKKKQVLIKSWITDGNFDSEGNYKDRNFGMLLDWLYDKGYQLWILPAFFNIKMEKRNLLSLLKKQKYTFLIPEDHLRFSDYSESLLQGYNVLKKKIDNFVVFGEDLSSLVDEVIKRHGFNISLRLLNLCCPVLKRLKKRDFKIDTFYYSFECDASEKQFLLSVRKYFSDASVIGYQHTTFFPNQLTYHFASDEKDFHPLPDKIICSGPIYMELHKQARFPLQILAAGPNLRFKSVYLEQKRKVLSDKGKKKVLLPLTFSYDLAFELLAKVKHTLKDSVNYQICIRMHPLLLKERLVKFLDMIGMNNYEFADQGIIQEWFPKVNVVISTGGSITVLEAICFGVPTIRVIPDNTFFYDPFSWPDYPLEPVNSSEDIRKQLELIDEINSNGKEVFSNIGERVLTQYFTKPSDDNLEVFLS